MKFAADIRTHFSVGESLLTPEDAASQAKAMGYDAAAIVDTMTISAMPDFTNAAGKDGIVPIIGVRLNIVETLDRVQKQRSCYPVLYILSDEGFRIVTRLLSIANDEDHFYYKPRLTWDDLLDALPFDSGHVAFSTGALYSALRDPRVGHVLPRIADALGRAHTLISITPSHSAVWDRQALVGYQLAEEHDLPILLANPAIAAGPGHWDHLGTMGSIASNSKRRGSFSAWQDDYYPKGTMDLFEQAIAQFKRLQSLYGLTAPADRLKQGLTTWKSFVDSVSFRWSKLPMSLPKMAEDENKTLHDLAVAGLKHRMTTGTFGNKYTGDPKVYADRLRYELSVITEMGFAGYFLLVREIVMFCKESDIKVGPGRGSVGGSLLAYALGITEVDPIRFGLIFERFLNPERLDLPDIDLDFMSERRHEVIEELVRRYGRDHVANISNYNTLGSRSTIQDICRILDLPAEYRNLSKSIPEEQASPIELTRAFEEVPEIKTFAGEQPRAWDICLALEGRIRNLAKHAAGVVVAGEPLTNRAVVENRSGENTVNWDKRTVEHMGLIKIDVLGLSTLDLIQFALKKIEARSGTVPDLGSVPLDNPEVLDNFGQGRTVGTFQYESGGMQKLLRNMASLDRLTFEDLMAASALYRPGPMESGLMDEYVEIKRGHMRPHYDHELMRPALERTFGVIVYQESVMQISRDLCGFTGPEADTLRKSIGKKDRDLMATMGDKFIAGAIASDMAKDDATELWEKIVKFAGYSFNASHSCAYALISYQAMWLKTFHPLEFFAAAMTIAGSDKMPGLMRDAQRMGVVVGPPDVNVSTTEFEIADENTLVAPLSALKGLSAKGTEKITEARKDGPFRDMKDFRARVAPRAVNKTVMANLELVGAFANIEPDSTSATDDARREDQLVLMPDVMLGGTIVTRTIPSNKAAKDAVLEAFSDPKTLSSDVFTDAPFVMPRFGKTPRFMAVLDGPGSTELKALKFTKGNSFLTLDELMGNEGLDVNDGYWTALCKTPKTSEDNIYTQAEIAANAPLLRAEMAILKPQVVLTLGTNAMRFFEPKIKGGCQDNAGKVIYKPETAPGAADDYNLVVGITPGMIYFDPSRSDLLVSAIQAVREMLF